EHRVHQDQIDARGPQRAVDDVALKSGDVGVAPPDAGKHLFGEVAGQECGRPVRLNKRNQDAGPGADVENCFSGMRPGGGGNLPEAVHYVSRLRDIEGASRLKRWRWWAATRLTWSSRIQVSEHALAGENKCPRGWRCRRERERDEARVAANRLSEFRADRLLV